MDFFEHQAQAKRRSRRLVVLFTAAVIAIVAVVYLSVSAALVWTAVPPALPPWFEPVRLALVAGGVVGVVALGSVWKAAQLGGSGARVAEMLGGRLVEPDSADPLERRLHNVVEELAIASGLPVPPVYVLDEPGINAFAAGTRPGNAVLGFTRGAIEKLSRSELQGVVGHEFSHVLNGDMRLNLRLIGVLHGILIIGLIGQYVFDGVRWAPTRSRRNTSSATAVALALGLTLVVLGLVGTFFGRLIQAALSRQREFLADASAVQFTRDPHGIAGALKKIGGFPSGSDVREKHAGEVSHMLFEEHRASAAARAHRGRRARLFATHPPLLERIERVEPGFTGNLEALTEPSDDDLGRARAEALDEERARASGLDPLAGLAAGFAGRSRAGTAAAHDGVGPPATGADRTALSGAALDRLRRRAGEVDRGAADLVAALLASLRPEVRRAAGEPYGARCVVWALVLADAPEVRGRQLELVEAAHPDDPGARRAVERLAPGVDALPATARLPVLDLCLRSLRELTPAQYRAFASTLDALIEADARLDLFEACLRRIVRTHLDRELDPPAARAGRGELSLAAAGGRAAVVLSLLVRVGQVDRGSRTEAERAFRAAAEPLGLELELLDARQAWRGFDAALEALARLRPDHKRAFLEAAARAIEHDGRVEVAEAELFRAVAETLGVPVPSTLAAADADGDPAPPAGARAAV